MIKPLLFSSSGEAADLESRYFSDVHSYSQDNTTQNEDLEPNHSYDYIQDNNLSDQYSDHKIEECLKTIVAEQDFLPTNTQVYEDSSYQAALGERYDSNAVNHIDAHINIPTSKDILKEFDNCLSEILS